MRGGMMALCFLAMVGAQAPIEPPTQGSMGVIETVIYDRVTEVEDPALSQDCSFWRARKTSFNYTTTQSDNIYYTTTQCLDAGQDVKYQQVFYAYHEEDAGMPLPPGCPPPTIAPPPQPDPCAEGASAGADFARTVARLSVPPAVRNATDGPLYNSTALNAYLAAPNDPTALANILSALLPIVKAKLDCVMGIAKPGGVFSLEYACAQAAASKNLAAAIAQVLQQLTLCRRVGCSALAAPSRGTAPSSPSAAGPPPGNYTDILTPNDGESYFVMSAATGYALTVNQAGMTTAHSSAHDSIYLETCTGSANERWTFFRQSDGSWKIFSVGGRYFIGSSNQLGQSYQLVNDTSLMQTMNYQLLPHLDYGFVITSPGQHNYTLSFEGPLGGSMQPNPFSVPAAQSPYPYLWSNSFVLRKACPNAPLPVPRPRLPYIPPLLDGNPYYIYNAVNHFSLYSKDTTSPTQPITMVQCGVSLASKGSNVWMFMTVAAEKFIIVNYDSNKALSIVNQTAVLAPLSGPSTQIFQMTSRDGGGTFIQHYNQTDGFLLTDSTGTQTQVSNFLNSNAAYYYIDTSCI